MKRRIFFLSLLLLLVFAVWRITSGGIPLDFLTPYFEEILSRNKAGWRLDAGATVLTWRGWSRPIDLNLRDVEVHDRDGERIVMLPTVSVGFSLSALLHGKIGVRRIEILDAEVLLSPDGIGRRTASDVATNSNETGDFAFGLMRQLLAPPDPAYPVSFLELVRVEAERMTWSDQERKFEISAAALSFDAQRIEAGLRCALTMQLDPGKGSTASGPTLRVEATAHGKESESVQVAPSDPAGGDLTVSLVARANDIEVSQLGRYWPPPLADSARSWVVQNVRSGHVEEAVLNLAFEHSSGPARLSRLDGTLRYAGLGVQYLADWPPASSIAGSGSFDAHGLRFDVASGGIGDLGVGRSTVDISGLDSDDERIRIQAKLSGASNAIVAMVTRTSSGPVDLLALDRTASSDEGTLDLEVLFPLHDDLSLADVIMNAQAALPGLSPRNPYVQGSLGASIQFQMPKGGKGTFDLDFDVSNSAMAIPFLGWRKAEGVSGRVELAMDVENLRPTGGRNLKIDAGTLQARGTLRFRDEGQSLESVELEEVTLGNTRLSTVTLRDSADGYRVDLGQGSVDVEPILHAANGSAEIGQGKPSSRNLVVDAPKLGRVLFAQDRFLEDVRLHAEQDGGEWRNVDISGKTPGNRRGQFEVDLKPADDGHQSFAVSADDAGSVLNILGVATELKGGRLKVTGETTGLGMTPLRARIEMREFAFLRASLLTRLLTIASGRGFGKLTTDDEVTFDYLGGEVTFADDRFTTDMLRAHGPALGLTATGWVDVGQNQILLDGAIIPAYAANRLLGKIPVLGGLLSGDGKDGFWAIRYRVKGDASHPEMEVDALTSLTPAFLRDVFGTLGKAVER